ncbi:hypothetical protein ACFUTV_40875 [Streptomyces sp. NPDC057298]|uniref:hypothetical protein n=1 Tax=Streptomyces sp. NPDC057298 TaxID=3346091 RepID=UPI00362C3723
MAHFNGDAVVVLADEAEYSCRATLQSSTEQVSARTFTNTTRLPGLTNWSGTIDLGDDGAAWAVQEADEPRLRIGDRESGFTVPGGNVGTGVLRIKGSGTPPFD